MLILSEIIKFFSIIINNDKMSKLIMHIKMNRRKLIVNLVLNKLLFLTKQETENTNTIPAINME